MLMLFHTIIPKYLLFVFTQFLAFLFCLCCSQKFDQNIGLISISTSADENKLFFFLSIFRLQDVKDEFDDFQEGSRELEAELEAQLEQYEKRVKELVSVRSSLEDENEMLKVSFFLYKNVYPLIYIIRGFNCYYH